LNTIKRPIVNMLLRSHRIHQPAFAVSLGPVKLTMLPRLSTAWL